MTILTNSFLDYLTPKERDFYSNYSPEMSADLTGAQRKTMRSVIDKNTQWRRDKMFVNVSALAVAKTADAKGLKEYKRIRDILYEAWVWGKTH